MRVGAMESTAFAAARRGSDAIRWREQTATSSLFEPPIRCRQRHVPRRRDVPRDSADVLAHSFAVHVSDGGVVVVAFPSLSLCLSGLGVRGFHFDPLSPRLIARALAAPSGFGFGFGVDRLRSPFAFAAFPLSTLSRVRIAPLRDGRDTTTVALGTTTPSLWCTSDTATAVESSSLWCISDTATGTEARSD